MSDREELGELDDLHKQGLLTAEEHRAAVDRVTSRDGGYEGDNTGDSAGAPGGGRDGRGLGARVLAFWPLLALLVGVALIIFAIVGTGSSGKKTVKEAGIVVNGAVIIKQSDSASLPDDPTVKPGATFGTGGYNVGKGCHTTSGFGDIAGDAPVIITDGSGNVILRTTLKSGVYDLNADCVFGFTGVVPKEDGYTIKVAQRNPLPYKQSEIGQPQLIL